jgi:hypothetical protein
MMSFIHIGFKLRKMFKNNQLKSHGNLKCVCVCTSVAFLVLFFACAIHRTLSIEQEVYMRTLSRFTVKIDPLMGKLLEFG